MLRRIKIGILFFEKAARGCIEGLPIMDVARLNQKQPKRLKEMTEGLCLASPLNAVKCKKVQTAKIVRIGWRTIEVGRARQRSQAQGQMLHMHVRQLRPLRE